MITTTQQKRKQLIDIYFVQDDSGQARELIEEYESYRQKYIDRGFTEQQAKYFNRVWEKDIEAIKNDDWIFLDVFVKADILMPCGHIERFETVLGGYIFDWLTMNLEKEFPNEVLGEIEELKDQIAKKIDINQFEFIINVDSDIRYS